MIGVMIHFIKLYIYVFHMSYMNFSEVLYIQSIQQEVKWGRLGLHQKAKHNNSSIKELNSDTREIR